MIIAAAACAVAGISYIFNDIQSISNDKSEKVTASSTIIDSQGILKYVIYPSMKFYQPSMIIYDEQRIMIRKYQLNQIQIPFNQYKQNHDLENVFSIIFFWSMPLNTCRFQLPIKSIIIMENSNSFQYYSMKISIGTQSEMNENLRSNSNETLDSLSFNPSINDSLMPIGILKKKKLDFDEKEIHGKRFCSDKETIEKSLMRNLFTNNVKLCVENLSKILTESYSNNTIQNSSSLIDEDLTSNKFHLHNDQTSSDGRILYRGEQFGVNLGEVMMPKLIMNKTHLFSSFHSINEFNRLFSKSTRLLMKQYQIKSIEDLIRLYLYYGKDYFIKLMFHIFKVDFKIIQQFHFILFNWIKQLN